MCAVYMTARLIQMKFRITWRERIQLQRAKKTNASDTRIITPLNCRIAISSRKAPRRRKSRFHSLKKPYTVQNSRKTISTA